MAAPRDLFHLVGTHAAGKYRIDEVIGENAYSVVYRARRHDGAGTVVVKVFKVLGEFSASEREAVVQSLLADSAAIGRLARRIEPICAAADVGRLTLRDGNWVPYMVFDWLDGASLRQIRDEEQSYGLPPRSLVQAMTLLEPAALALAAAHHEGVVHAGLTPSSVFVLGDPRAETVRLRLIDFGVARALSDARGGGPQRASHPSHGVTLTPTYYKAEFAAPEQVDFTGHPIGVATDVFSFALVVAYLLGYPPADPHAARDPSYYRGTPGARGLLVPAAAERVFARALSRDPGDRPATIGQLWNELRRARGLPVLEELGASADEEDPDGSAPTLRVQPLDEQESERLIALPATASDADKTIQRAPVSAEPAATRGGTLPWLVTLLFFAALGAAGYRFRDDIARRIRALQGDAPVPSAPAPSAAASAVASSSASAAPPAPSPCPESMVLVPAGELAMGHKSEKPTAASEPVHTVQLDAFCIDVHEVTVAEYRACSDRGACKRASTTNEWPRIRPPERAAFDPECNIQHEERADHPINCVTWEMADIYCRAQDARLPTEAEWEHAARGSDARHYPWGREDPDIKRLNACGRECVAWHEQHRMKAAPLFDADDGAALTAPVGSYDKGASPFGVHDLAGNVWEWVADWYGPYSADRQENPRGPAAGVQRVVRGGAFNVGDSDWVRASYRHREAPATSSWVIGFRCAAAPR